MLRSEKRELELEVSESDVLLFVFWNALFYHDNELDSQIDDGC